MLTTKLSRTRDAVLALYFLLRVRTLYWRGNKSVARATAAAMKRTPSSQEYLDTRGVQAWHVARAVWRAKGWLPFHSTCLQTALATQMLFDARGIGSTVRVGVHSLETEAHAWVEVGNFVLDDQRISSRFSAFETGRAAPDAGDA
jgi:hypothetical protein